MHMRLLPKVSSGDNGVSHRKHNGVRVGHDDVGADDGLQSEKPSDRSRKIQVGDTEMQRSRSALGQCSGDASESVGDKPYSYMEAVLTKFLMRLA